MDLLALEAFESDLGGLQEPESLPGQHFLDSFDDTHDCGTAIHAFALTVSQHNMDCPGRQFQPAKKFSVLPSTDTVGRSGSQNTVGRSGSMEENSQLRQAKSAWIRQEG